MAEKPNFDKIINSSQNIIPKRLSFDFLNNSQSAYQSITKKRRMEDSSVFEVDQSTLGLSRTVNDTLNSSSGSVTGIAPWEIKILRIDLAEAQSRIAQLKKEIQHQTTIQQELEMKFTAKERSLASELGQQKTKAQEFEKVLKKNRKNENNLKEDLVKANNQISMQKQTFDQALFKLQNENKSIKETLNYKTNSLQNNISELTRELTEIKNLYETSEKENETLREVNDDLIAKTEDYKNVRNELEQEKLKLQEAQMRLKDLEYQVNSYGDWKDVEKASTTRMTGMSDMEKEVTRLRQVNRSLHDAMGNKLLLEEQVHSFKTRLERYEHESEDQIALKAKIDALERELQGWKQFGSDFVPKGLASNPINVRNYVESLLHRDLQLVSEKTSEKSSISAVQNELSDLKIKYEALVKQADSQEKSLKTHQAIVHKLQKKMKIVSMERDHQRQLLESYERDLTITQGNAPPSTSAMDTQNRLRMEMLTNSVTGYKELCARLESELAELRGNPSLADTSMYTSEQFKALRKDLEVLRSENEKLRKRKNELEIEIENSTLRNNFIDDPERLKVVHFENNPAKIAQENVADEMAKMKAEIERLRNRNRKLEEGNADLTSRINETMNMTLGVKDLQKLKEDYAQLQAKYQENEALFAKVNNELREVVYSLFGFKLDRFGDNNYRIISMFADHETDFLLFQMLDDGELNMMETEYSKFLLNSMSQYLQGPNGNLPTLLSALTLELVNKMTVTTVS